MNYRRPPSHKKLLVASICGVASTVACSQQSERVLQLPFGQPLDRDIQQCSVTAKVVPDYCGLGKPYKRSPALKSTSIMVLPPPSGTDYSVPTWVAVEPIHLSFNDKGEIYRIMVQTKGPSRQDEVIASIAARFGNPSTQAQIPSQNQFGAQLVVKRVNWDRPNIQIYHDCLKMDMCAVVFTHPQLAPVKAAVKPPPTTP